MPRWTALSLAILLTAPACGLFPYFGIDDIHEELVAAARLGDVTTIERIAKDGIDLDQPFAHGRNGWTPLQTAIDKQRYDAVRVLLEWGADPDATQGSNKPPLLMARDTGNEAIVKLLINAGATPTDASAGTPATAAESRP